MDLGIVARNVREHIGFTIDRNALDGRYVSASAIVDYLTA